MSVDHSDAMRAPEPGSAAFWAHAAAAASRADSRLAAQIQDLFLSDADRLDDRTRAAAAATLRMTVLAMAHDLARDVADQLPGHAVDHAGGTSPDQAAAAVSRRLHGSGLLRDRALMEELFARVRQDMVSEALRANRVPAAEPTLLAEWVASGDDGLSRAAMAYGQAEARRQAEWRADLPLALHEKLLWWVAAALREQWAVEGGQQILVDRAIAQAAQRSMAGDDDQDRLEAAADRLVAALGANGADLAERLIAALEEGHLALFIALLSQALALDFVEVRALVLDPHDDRFWVALRGVDLERAAIARIGFLLADADPRRDLDAFADRLDAIAAIAAPEAAEGLAPMALPRQFREAQRALERTPDRAPDRALAW
ncbi:DUF2336 domain-containing protein [Sphingomonas mucosissima]|uniref:DUF2336 domain-containing protein n=1 Tax=Sphingomonas mucosissima TaxID=370959 RepID=A0A245ZLR7_9SPHN|nr:DUF2336 domain-containing protein [Sphingomonas mucosissima]OWK30673.1 hypothetical protein SPMU_16620 [Sphingomonas mucosissima]